MQYHFVGSKTSIFILYFKKGISYKSSGNLYWFQIRFIFAFELNLIADMFWYIPDNWLVHTQFTKSRRYLKGSNTHLKKAVSKIKA